MKSLNHYFKVKTRCASRHFSPDVAPLSACWNRETYSSHSAWRGRVARRAKALSGSAPSAISIIMNRVAPLIYISMPVMPTDLIPFCISGQTLLCTSIYCAIREGSSLSLRVRTKRMILWINETARHDMMPDDRGRYVLIPARSLELSAELEVDERAPHLHASCLCHEAYGECE